MTVFEYQDEVSDISKMLVRGFGVAIKLNEFRNNGVNCYQIAVIGLGSSNGRGCYGDSAESCIEDFCKHYGNGARRAFVSGTGVFEVSLPVFKNLRELRMKLELMGFGLNKKKTAENKRKK